MLNEEGLATRQAAPVLAVAKENKREGCGGVAAFLTDGFGGALWPLQVMALLLDRLDAAVE